MLTLTLVFNTTKDKVLMCFHKKIGQWNYVSGQSEDGEIWDKASYRVLNEETGITEDDVELIFIREEKIVAKAEYYPSHDLKRTWDTIVTAGILKHDVELVNGENYLQWNDVDDIRLMNEKNHLQWIDVDDVEHFVHASVGLGVCYTYLLEAMDVLNIKK